MRRRSAVVDTTTLQHYNSRCAKSIDILSLRSFLAHTDSWGANSWKYEAVSVLNILLLYLVGGVAQWLERRSLVGGLSFIYTWSTVACDHFVTISWVRCPLWVTNQAKSAFHPFGVGKWVLIHVIMNYRGWRQLNGRPGWRMVGW